MNTVMIVSPYSANPLTNSGYARDCMKDSLRRGEAPFASHLLYPLVLDDATPQERDQGMQASYAWMAACHAVACYVDLGWSPGMVKDLKMAIVLSRRIEMRALRVAGSNAERWREPLDVADLIRHAESAGLTVITFDSCPRPFKDYQPMTIRRRHKLSPGECSYCDRERTEGNSFHPPHDASPRCESNHHPHCSCDICF